MKQTLRLRHWLASAAALLLAVAADAQPVVTGLSPAAAPAAATVTINGTGFAATAAQNAVYFGPARATVTAATATQLTVRVPAGAASVAPVVVTNLATRQLGSSLASGTPFFTLLFAGPGLNGSSYQATNYPVTTPQTNGSSLATADFNADAYPDFAVVTGGGLVLLLSDGQGGFGSPISLATSTGYVKAADVDANGTPDLLVAGTDLLLFRNLGNGNGFAAAAALNLNGQRVLNSYSSSLDVQDMNADGLPDLVTTITDGAPQVGGGAQLVVLRNNGNGFDAPAVLLRDRLQGQAVADFNQDGRLDVVAVSPSFANTASLLLLVQNAAGTGFAAPETTNLGSSSFVYGAPLVGDANADGRPDVLVSGQINGVEGLVVAQRTATGFSLLGPYPSALGLQAVADVDGNGLPDALVTTPTGFTVLRGQAGGGFGQPISYGAAGGPLVAGDFDRDGRTDVATFDVASGNLALFRYTGASPNTNGPPTLNALADLTMDEDAPQQSIALGGISNGGDMGQAVTITAVSSNPNLVPNPTVAYFSPTSTGTLRLRPAPDAFGTCTITVTASDGQAQNGTVTRTFRVTVNPVNDAPTLDPIPDVIITAATLAASQNGITVALSGITSGAANENQVLSLSALPSFTIKNVGGLPNGTFTYASPATTGAYQLYVLLNGPYFGPGLQATVVVSVTDGQPTNNTISRTFRVYYNPDGTAPNQPTSPPTLDAVADVTASRGPAAQTPVALAGIGDGDPNQVLPLAVAATSSDPDLVSVGPAAYTSPAASGALPYTISSTRGGTALVSVTVSNGQPQNGSVTRSFRVTVPGPATVTGTRGPGGSVAFSLYPNPAPGGRFRLASPVAGPLDVTVLDLSGRAVFARQLAVGQQQLELPPATAPGVYLVRINTAQGAAVRRLVVE
ncbi:MAG: FG-GAP-like repeat-containing protein [Janthinobacterium lividum]